MTNTFTIYEDYHSHQPDLISYSDELKSLEKLIKKENVSLSFDGSIQIKHYVGFFQKGNFRLQILPKLYYDSIEKSDLQEQKESLRFVFRLLEATKFFEFKSLDVSTFSSEETDLFEILIKIFIDQFHLIFNRGIFSDYVNVEDNLPLIRGKIDFPQTLKRNVFTRHLHYLHYDEFTINNPLNQFLKATIFRLLRATKDAYNKKRLRLAIAYLQDVDDVLVTPLLIQQIHFTRRNLAYRPLYNLARLFQHNLSPGLSQGSENTFSFLIPINELFEAYVGQLLAGFNNNSLSFRHHKKPFSELVFKEKDSLYSIYPDYTLSIDKQYVSILDAKYKCPLNGNSFKIVREDIYQLTTYAVHFGCNTVYLIYPMFKDTLIKDNLIGTFEIKLSGRSICLKVIQLDLENFADHASIIRELIVDKEVWALSLVES